MIYNQFKFIKNNKKLILNPILEIGSKMYSNEFNLRKIFNIDSYIGIDLFKGINVDIIIDLTKEFNEINKILLNKRFNTIICMNVLEHCKNPFKMCENISKLLNINGKLFISVPFAWRLHSYPSDYWRFTFEGIKILFPNISFSNFHNNISTCKINEIKNINSNNYKIDFKPSFFNRIIRKIGLLNKLFDYPYLLLPSVINLIGVKLK